MTDFARLHALYRAELLERTVPFWLRHGIDRRHGGLCTCLADDGTLLSSDKYVWSQLRAIWTFSALHNRIEKKPAYLDVATHVFDFIKHRGRDAHGDWFFCLDADGAPLHGGATSLYCAAFAIYGFTEYARATGSEEALALALETFRHAQRRLARPGSYQTHPWPIPAGMKAHGVAMIFASAFDELGALLGEPAIQDAALAQAREVMELFLHPERRRVYEFVRLDGTPMEEPPGRTVNPGHAIESMWFMIHLFQRVGDHERVRQCIEAIRRHLELGWDEEHGGLFLALDAAGSPWEKKWDLKLWWPHTEALYALLLAHSISGEAWCMTWFQRVHDYAFRHFPVRDHGEWIQNLDRQGRKLEGVVALPVKDPFHLSRALILSVGQLERFSPAP
ncbi:MAG TPA: AGE family epimerase/isomerase [Chthoniobacteraceae bacterium]|jgi:N-acylglucosamine 2-epimerase|nr:AGE family epimerase/isomerase [Chthoniobacteraceae bacterium]